jgi:hypothetical protein
VRQGLCDEPPTLNPVSASTTTPTSLIAGGDHAWKFRHGPIGMALAVVNMRPGFQR